MSDQPLRRQRAGNIIIIAALSFTALAGMGALVVDLSYAKVVQQQLQTTADAAAHAAVMALDGTGPGVVDAHSRAAAMGTANPAAGRPITLNPGTSILAGAWDYETDAFDKTATPADTNAVQVIATDPEVKTWFAWIAFDENHLEAAATSTYARAPGTGASAVSCYLPIAIPSCLLEAYYGLDGIQDVDLVLNPAGIDNAGWASPFGTPSATYLSGHFVDCGIDGVIQNGTNIHFNNGVITSVLMTAQATLESSDTYWDSEIWGALPAQASNSDVDPSAYGNTVEASILVFDDDSYCTGGGGSWTGSAPVQGFAWAAIYDVAWSGAASDSGFRMRIDTTRWHMVGEDGGGRDYGVSRPRPIRVN